MANGRFQRIANALDGNSKGTSGRWAIEWVGEGLMAHGIEPLRLLESVSVYGQVSKEREMVKQSRRKRRDEKDARLKRKES